MESFATAYPVVFHDGEQELDKGQIGVHSVLSFKKFQAQLGRLVGLAPGQLSTVFVCRKANDKKQKLPINETTNFSIILNQHNPLREKNCHFLVSIKRSKKERKVGGRRRSNEADNGDDDDSNSSSRGDVSPLDERPKPGTYSESTSPTSILQRQLSPVGSPPGEAHTPGSGGDKTRILLAGTTEKVERILMRRGEAGASRRVEGFTVEETLPLPVVAPPGRRFVDSSPAGLNRVEERGSGSGSGDRVEKVRCEVCERKGSELEFHACINDRVLVGFRRSPAAGVIQRPATATAIKLAA